MRSVVIPHPLAVAARLGEIVGAVSIGVLVGIAVALVVWAALLFGLVRIAVETARDLVARGRSALRHRLWQGRHG